MCRSSLLAVAPSAGCPVALLVFESAVGGAGVAVAEVDFVSFPHWLSASCAWVAWFPGCEQLLAEFLVCGAVAAPGGVGAFVACFGCCWLAGGAAHCGGGVAVVELAAGDAPAFGHVMPAAG